MSEYRDFTRRPLRRLALMGILIALEIVLNRFLSINAWNIKIGFNFVPIVIAAMLLGPLQGGLVAALGDLIGALLFPIGAYFPGFTLTAFLTGLTFGLFLYHRQTVVRTALAALVSQGVLGLWLNTLWIWILYGSSFRVLLATRLVQCGVLLVVQFAGTLLIGRAVPILKKKAIV